MNYILVQHEEDSDRRGIMCLTCGRTSWHPQDVAHKYCGACQVFHEDEVVVQRLPGGVGDVMYVIPMSEPVPELPEIEAFGFDAGGYGLVRLRFRPKGSLMGTLPLEAFGPYETRGQAMMVLYRMAPKNLRFHKWREPVKGRSAPVAEDDTFLYYIVPIVKGMPSGPAT